MAKKYPTTGQFIISARKRLPIRLKRKNLHGYFYNSTKKEVIISNGVRKRMKSKINALNFVLSELLMSFLPRTRKIMMKYGTISSSKMDGFTGAPEKYLPTGKEKPKNSLLP